MLCNECNENQAQITYTTIENNQVKEVHICHECMQKLLGQDLQIPLFQDPNMGNFMDQIFSLFFPKGGEEEGDISCPYCGHSLREFQKTSLLGCQHCYESFKEELEKIIPRLQGSSHHVGHVPEDFEERLAQAMDQGKDIGQGAQASRIQELKEALRLAIEEERYEEAALLRDEIKEIEGEGLEDEGSNTADI